MSKSQLNRSRDNDTNFDNISKARDKVDTIRVQMHDNVNMALNMGKQYDELVDKTAELEQGAGLLNTNARKLKDKLWWKNVKMYLIIGGIIALILAIIITIAVIMSQNNKSSGNRRLDNANYIANYFGNNIVLFLRTLQKPILTFPFPNKNLRGNP